MTPFLGISISKVIIIFVIQPGYVCKVYILLYMIESRIKHIHAFNWLINSLEYYLTDMVKSVGYGISK